MSITRVGAAQFVDLISTGLEVVMVGTQRLQLPVGTEGKDWRHETVDTVER